MGERWKWRLSVVIDRSPEVCWWPAPSVTTVGESVRTRGVTQLPRPSADPWWHYGWSFVNVGEREDTE